MVGEKFFSRRSQYTKKKKKSIVHSLGKVGKINFKMQWAVWGWKIRFKELDRRISVLGNSFNDVGLFLGMLLSQSLSVQNILKVHVISYDGNRSFRSFVCSFSPSPFVLTCYLLPGFYYAHRTIIQHPKIKCIE